jgi:3-oxoacyl-[acyl-carrier protein] reductase
VAHVNGAGVVFGGASGIGHACSEALAAAGWTVVVADLRPPSGDPAAIVVDVRDRDAVGAAADRVAEAYGDIGAVVFAAGTARLTPVLDISPREWELVIGVNLSGALNVLQACAPHLPEGGSLTFISSVDSAAPVAGLAHYSAAKAGLEALVRSAALELGSRGIRCNAVLPGVVRTPLMEPMLARPDVADAFVAQTPLGRIADPADVGDVIAFLASPGARWITGVSLKVDGGMSLREHPQLLEEPAVRP